MLTNYHTHTTFCDGKNTPEEIVQYGMERGFSAIGFSGHGYTPFDLSYCMKDTDGYVSEISRLKTKYGKKIKIYCGVEEDIFSFADKGRFDYIIGSSHYLNIGGQYFSIDSDYDGFKKCLGAFRYDVSELAEAYYSTLVDYFKKRKPDIAGHFDLITKYDEIDVQRFLNNPEYLKIAEKYVRMAAEVDMVFEVNTGAIARGLRNTPYPQEKLLYILRDMDCQVMLSSDCHSVQALDFHFEETEKLLRDIGFVCVYELDEGVFRKRFI